MGCVKSLRPSFGGLRRQIIFYRAAFFAILRSKIAKNAALEKFNFAAVGGKILFTQPKLKKKELS
jgi:hypothetical protein